MYKEQKFDLILLIITEIFIISWLLFVDSNSEISYGLIIFYIIFNAILYLTFHYICISTIPKKIFQLVFYMLCVSLIIDTLILWI